VDGPLTPEELEEFGSPTVIPGDPGKARVALERLRAERRAVGRRLTGADMVDVRRRVAHVVTCLEAGEIVGVTEDARAALEALRGLEA
jgi:hypothetical protein